jgi:hypothetical protein
MWSIFHVFGRLCFFFCEMSGRAPVACTCNPSYLGDLDQEEHSLRPAWVNSLQDHISKITRAKWTGGVAQVIESLLCKNEFKSQSYTKKEMSKSDLLPIFYLVTFFSVLSCLYILILIFCQINSW